MPRTGGNPPEGSLTGTVKQDSTGSRNSGKKWNSGRGRTGRGLHLGEPGAELMYGRDFEDDSIPISEIDELSGTVVIYGEIIDTEMRTLRSERVLLILTVTDDTDTIRVKLFLDGEEQEAAGTMLWLRGA